MNTKNLFWIIPSCVAFGFMFGAIAGVEGISSQYEVIDCILYMETNAGLSGGVFTDESVKEAIQWRCATENINISYTDYEDILVFK